MNSRERFHQTLSFVNSVAPPRYESEFAPEVIEFWRARGFLSAGTPEEHFHLDQREEAPVQWRRLWEEKTVVESEAGLAAFLRAFDPARTDRFPPDWDRHVDRYRHRDGALGITPWHEGFFQVIGIGDWTSFEKAIFLLYDNPGLVHRLMDHYADYLEHLINRVLKDVKADYAVFYEAIASNHAPVVSPATYAEFALPALCRVVACLERHGIAHRFLWTSGHIQPLLPVWLDAGINGLITRQCSASGISYMALRREYGTRLRFMGGIDWHAVAAGRRAIDAELDRTVQPLLEEGGYIPHLDDTVRLEISFENYCYYRDRLDHILSRND